MNSYIRKRSTHSLTLLVDLDPQEVHQGSQVSHHPGSWMEHLVPIIILVNDFPPDQLIQDPSLQMLVLKIQMDLTLEMSHGHQGMIPHFVVDGAIIEHLVSMNHGQHVLNQVYNLHRQVSLASKRLLPKRSTHLLSGGICSQTIKTLGKVSSIHPGDLGPEGSLEMLGGDLRHAGLEGRKKLWE